MSSAVPPEGLHSQVLAEQRRSADTKAEGSLEKTPCQQSPLLTRGEHSSQSAFTQGISGAATAVCRVAVGGLAYKRTFRKVEMKLPNGGKVKHMKPHIGTLIQKGP